MATPQELFLRQMDCLEKDDRETQLALYSEDCVYEFPFANDRPRRMVGRDEIRRVMMPMWEEGRRHGAKVAPLEYTLHPSTDPDKLAVEFTLRVEVNGKASLLMFVQFLRVKGEEITHMREYFNPQARSEILR